MANTYTQIHIQTIWAVQNRDCLIAKEWKEELHSYITGIVQNKGHKVLRINSMPDHVHLFFGMRPKEALSDLMKIVKQESTNWIKEQGFLKTQFSWQEGYGGFSYAKSQIPKVIRYIENQEEHHKKKTFIEEYVEFLDAFEVDYDERYIFKPVL